MKMLLNIFYPITPESLKKNFSNCFSKFSGGGPRLPRKYSIPLLSKVLGGNWDIVLQRDSENIFEIFLFRKIKPVDNFEKIYNDLTTIGLVHHVTCRHFLPIYYFFY